MDHITYKVNWLGCDELDLSTFNLDDMYLRLKKFPASTVIYTNMDML